MTETGQEVASPPRVNYFAWRSAAERYVLGRKFFHPQIIDRVRQLLPGRLPLRRGLDVGCGTGLSTRALASIARTVIGVDASEEMLSLARTDDAITYRLDEAEVLASCKAREFDIVTACQLFHWVDPDRFLAQASRVLRDEAWLVVYDNYFTAVMPGQPGFALWYRNEFMRRFPSLGRRPVAFEQAALDDFGLHLVHQECRDLVLDFTATELVDFLVSQTNVIACVEQAGEPLHEVRQWITARVRHFFDARSPQPVMHRAPLWIMRRAESLRGYPRPWPGSWAPAHRPALNPTKGNR